MIETTTLLSSSCFSTNKISPPVSLKQAIFCGAAPDGGLYVPHVFPRLTEKNLNEMRFMPYHEVAFIVLFPLFKPWIGADDFRRILQERYTFDLPFERIGEHAYCMRQDRGPSASFKDFGLLFLEGLISYWEWILLLLNATSGDTGASFAKTFRRGDGSNIMPFAVAGKFDDCQDLVSKALVDPDLSGLPLSSPNSINLARILAQVVYYVYAYARVRRYSGQRIVFAVPSGNFGNMVACVYAKRMGVPIDKIVVATNENNAFPIFMSMGVYMPIIPSRECDSNSMNVGNPSNLRRLFACYDGQVDKQGVVHIMPDIARMRSDLFATKVSDEETREAMQQASLYGTLLEPHGAVAYEGLRRYAKDVGYLNGLKRTHEIMVFLETAHPAKFPDKVVAATGHEPELPESMRGLSRKIETYSTMPVNYDLFKEIVMSAAKNLSRTAGIILFPEHEVSELQRRQMTTY